MSESGREKGEETWEVSALAKSDTPRLKRSLVIEALKQKKKPKTKKVDTVIEEDDEESSDDDDTTGSDDSDDENEKTVSELGECNFSAGT